jgi:hypothetical protein
LAKFGDISVKFCRNKPIFRHFVSAKFRFGKIFRFGGNPRIAVTGVPGQ